MNFFLIDKQEPVNVQCGLVGGVAKIEVDIDRFIEMGGMNDGTII